MKRKRPASSAMTKQRRARELQNIEKMLSVTLMLLEHNIVKLLRYRRAR